MRKKVCHLSYNHGPFDDRIYWKELITLKEAGYEVIHICVGDEEKDFISEEGVRIIQVKHIVSKHNIWMKRILHFFLSNETINAILRKTIEVEADIYHYHDLQLNALVKKIKKLPNRPKVIYDSHEAYHLQLQKDDVNNIFIKYLRQLVVQLISKWELSSAKKCDLIIVTAPYLYYYFKKRTPFVPSIIIYNYSYFNNSHALSNLTEEKIYDFIYSGEISEIRGISEIVKAFSLLKVQKPNSKMLLVGPFVKKEYLNELSNLLMKLNLVDSIIIHPPVPFSEVSKYYQKSKIGLCLLHQTLSFKQALPIKLFEYMSFGLPVIFANHGPSVNIIEESGCGLLVNEKDELSICNGMRTLLESKELFNNCSSNGIRYAKTKYNWNVEKEKLLKVYSEI